jgi:hypothetical protein
VLAIDLLRDALVVERTELLLIVDVDHLLRARKRASNIELHAAANKELSLEVFGGEKLEATRIRQNLQSTQAYRACRDILDL